MVTPISSIIRQATRLPDEKYNILSWVCHERYQSNWSNCFANFYLLQNGPGVKGMWKKEYAQIPNNTVILPCYQNNPLEVIPSWLQLDGIISHHKFGILQTALQLGQHLSLPVIHLEHTMPTNPQLQAAVPQLKELRGDINIFISSTSRSQWDYNEIEAEVIEHGIDSIFWKPSGRQRKQQILTVGNDFINRGEILGFDILQRVCKDLPLRIVGDTNGLSKPARNEYELKNIYNESLIYINPSRFSPIPMSLLEAASMGCAIVTTDNNLISDIFTNGENAIKTNNETEMRSEIIRLLNDSEDCRRMGENAREMIKRRFNLDRFVSDWNNIFGQMAGINK